MKETTGFYMYTSKSGSRYDFHFDSDVEIAWAVKLASANLPGPGVGRDGPEIKAKSQNDAREKLINLIESDNSTPTYK